MEIFLADSAAEDLEGIKRYYLEEGVPQVGQQQVAAIIKQVEVLMDHPDMGRIVPEFEKEEIRELIRPPFRIVYLKQSDAIYIVRVWRSERQLQLPDEARGLL